MGLNSKERFSFAKGYRGRTLFLMFDFALLGALMCMMVLPLIKVLVDSVDPTSYGVRLIPRVVDFSAYEMIISQRLVSFVSIHTKEWSRWQASENEDKTVISS